MSLQFFGHPFSSYTQKVLIALWADETPFEYRILEQDHPENFEELKRHSPYGLFPLIIDDGRPVFESTTIIEHLQAHHPGPNRWIPDGEEGRRVRFLDRFFDLYVMGNMQVPVADRLRPDGTQDALGVERARQKLHVAYDWLEDQIGNAWAAGDRFTLADCAAAPSLFYADWVEEIGDGRPKLKAYRERLLAHPVVVRAVDEGRPYRAYFPLGAPDRD
ncbi:glutathione S-transferase family protein [Sphingomonas sp. SM33]|uniref:Glutathione S-transferase family protein n=1 Tax=Sphingomonas telluris TaxID=2907998 RepID=A0ABS9VQV5_9SPHN|nr:glutathione S-transferase family protein [Sphingomonas telluris]MCH8617073.1 glutathione S-transferase family protein [Sphingomonas telluris]